MEFYYKNATLLYYAALTRVNIKWIKIVNTKAFASLVALSRSRCTSKVDGSRGFILTKDNCVVV
jgi:hypothetical protein